MLDKGYVNSRIKCPVCDKDLAKNYMLTHLRTKHANVYEKEFWNKYSERYKKIVEDNKKLFSLKQQ